MKHTMKVYKKSAEHSAYHKARFDKNNAGQSFEWAGHRWAYDMTSFDDAGDYDLLYRFDDQPSPEEITVSTDDMTIRDYFAAKAMQSIISSPKEMESLIDTLGAKTAYAKVSETAYIIADKMLRAREDS